MVPVRLSPRFRHRSSLLQKASPLQRALSSSAKVAPVITSLWYFYSTVRRRVCCSDRVHHRRRRDRLGAFAPVPRACTCCLINSDHCFQEMQRQSNKSAKEKAAKADRQLAKELVSAARIACQQYVAASTVCDVAVSHRHGTSSLKSWRMSCMLPCIG